MNLEQRITAALWSKPEICSLKMGPMNFSPFEMQSRDIE